MPSPYEQVAAIESVLFDLIDPNNEEAVTEIQSKLDLGWGLLDIFQMLGDYKNDLLGGSGGGVTDHGLLTGLADDDHPQYLNNTRGDTRYYTKGQTDSAISTAITAISLPLTSVTDAGAYVRMLGTERTKLTGIATGATANSTDAVLLNLGNATGTLDANKIADNAGSAPTDGRKFTKAHADLVARVPASGTILSSTDLDAHKAKTDGTAHGASGIAMTAACVAGDLVVFGVDVADTLIPLLDWSVGDNMSGVLDDLANAIAIANIQNNAHIGDTTSVHGISNTSLLIAKNTAGVIRLTKASTPPPVGTNPPVDSVDLWVDAAQDVHIRNKDGEETTLVPGWRNVYVRSTADFTVTSDATNFTAVLTCPENLVVGAEYLVSGQLFYFAADASSGGIQIKWTTPASTSFDWSAVGPSFQATTGLNRKVLTMTAQHGTVSSTLSGYGGQGATQRVPLRVEGNMRINTAGAPILLFSQASSNATATIVKANSYLKFERVA
jgi:hypothetical protein